MGASCLTVVVFLAATLGIAARGPESAPTATPGVAPSPGPSLISPSCHLLTTRFRTCRRSSGMPARAMGIGCSWMATR